MAETIALALEGCFEEATLDKDISQWHKKEITAWVMKHSFYLSGFYPFECIVTEAQIKSVRMRARQARKRS